MEEEEEMGKLGKTKPTKPYEFSSTSSWNMVGREREREEGVEKGICVLKKLKLERGNAYK